MAVLTPANAFPGIPAPNHLSGQSHPQNFLYPGAVQPLTRVKVLSAAVAFPGIPYPNHLSGQSHPQDQLFQGGLQPPPTIFIPEQQIDPVRAKLGLPSAEQQFLAFGVGLPNFPTKNLPVWLKPFELPVRIKPGLRPEEQQFLAYAVGLPNFPLRGPLAWYEPYSEPVRVKPRSADNPFFAFDPSPFIAAVNFGYYTWLSEPVRPRQGLRSEQQQTLAETLALANLPLSGPLAWYEPYTDPVKQRFQLAPNRDFYAYAAGAVIPIPISIGWYFPLESPVRIKLGLQSTLQQFFTYPPRLLPTPNVTLTMNAFETGKDIAEFGIYVSMPPVKAKVSIIQIPAIRGGNVSFEG